MAKIVVNLDDRGSVESITVKARRKEEIAKIVEYLQLKLFYVPLTPNPEEGEPV